MAEFEYTCVAGVHQCWGLQRDDKEIGDETDQLSDIQEAVADSIVDYCKQHSTTVASVRGGHGWRDFTTATGAVVQFRWSSTERDFRCHDCGYDTWDETCKVHDVSGAAQANQTADCASNASKTGSAECSHPTTSQTRI